MYGINKIVNSNDIYFKTLPDCLTLEENITNIAIKYINHSNLAVEKINDKIKKSEFNKITELIGA